MRGESRVSGGQGQRRAELEVVGRSGGQGGQQGLEVGGGQQGAQRDAPEFVWRPTQQGRGVRADLEDVMCPCVGRQQHSVGLDTALYLSDTFSFTGQMAASYGDGAQTDYAFFLRPSYDSSTFHTHIRYTYLGENFGDNANAVGFIRDDDRHELDSDVNKTFWFKESFLERIDYKSNYNIYWGMDRTLRSWQGFQSVTVDFQNKLGFMVRHDREFKLFEKELLNLDKQKVNS